MNSCDEELLAHWLSEIRSNKADYKEPILGEATVNKIKLFCDTLQQDSHVFLMSVEIVERYVSAKKEMKRTIGDPLLVIITTIYLSSKHIGEISDFKTSNLITLYERLTSKTVTHRTIKLIEMDILITLDYRLPLYTNIDDLKTFLQCYMAPFKMKFDLSGLCEELLNFFTIYRMLLFVTLKLQYLQNIEACNAFWCIYTNRMYLPIGILLCALKMTKIKNFMDVGEIVKELSELSNIHSDHLKFLSDEIYKLWVAQKKQSRIKV